MHPDKNVFMFSGQGSQYHQMGKPLFESDPQFRRHMLRLAALAKTLSGLDVLETTHNGAKGDVFDRTLATHPAIFMTEYALALRLIESGIVPDAVLGSSLGSFAAATVAGCLSEEDAMAAVVAQARAFESTCEPGGMTAVLAEPEIFDREPFLHGASELAAINFDKHFGVSATRADLDAIDAELKRRGITHQRLAVSFAFHSRWVDSARERFLDSITGLSLRPASLPILCCDRGGPVGPALPPDYFWHVVRHPIRFQDTVRHLESKGAWRYIDVGPSGTMATFAKYALPDDTSSSTHPILTPYGQDARNLSTLSALAA